MSHPIHLRTTLRRRSSAPVPSLQEHRSRANALEAHECGSPSGPQCVLTPLAFPWSTDRSRLAATVGLPLAVYVNRFERSTWFEPCVFLVAIVVLGTIATPGLGAVALVVAPLLGLGLVWRIALTVSTHGRSVDAVVHTRQGHLLGPGGSDDSFAVSPLDDDEYLTEASARASMSGRNGFVRGANVRLSGLSETLSVRPRGENWIQGGGG